LTSTRHQAIRTHESEIAGIALESSSDKPRSIEVYRVARSEVVAIWTQDVDGIEKVDHYNTYPCVDMVILHSLELILKLEAG